MSSYFNLIPDFNKHVPEIESFLQRLTDNQYIPEQWSLLWKNLNIVCIKSVAFENKWKGYKKSTGITPIHVIKRDIDSLVHGLDGLDIFRNESAVEWGIRSSQSMIDTFPYLLPYFAQTYFINYIEEIGNLLEAVILQTKHSEVLKLLREIREHPDITTIGQFSTNEMVDCCKHLKGNKPLNTRQEIIEYIDIYQKFCGIYEKDMILCYCLLQLKEKGYRDTYVEAHPESRNPQGRINYVKSRINLFGEIYDSELRNADAHNDIVSDSNRHSVTIYRGSGKVPKYYTYDKIVSMTRDMSALIIAFRLLVVVLANRDWKTIRHLLQ